MKNYNTLRLLENKIYSIVKQVIREVEEEKKEEKKTKRHDDNVVSNDSYKRQYREVEEYLDRPEIDATQVMANALGFDPSDDAERSHAFKKLHKEPTPDKTGKYKFSREEVTKIHGEIA